MYHPLVLWTPHVLVLAAVLAFLGMPWSEV